MLKIDSGRQRARFHARAKTARIGMLTLGQRELLQSLPAELYIISPLSTIPSMPVIRSPLLYTLNQGGRAPDGSKRPSTCQESGTSSCRLTSMGCYFGMLRSGDLAQDKADHSWLVCQVSSR